MEFIQSTQFFSYFLKHTPGNKKSVCHFYFQYNLIPKSVLSLKVIQELPIIVVLMYQLYKQNVHQEVSNFIPLIMETITLQPAVTHRYNLYINFLLVLVQQSKLDYSVGDFNGLRLQWISRFGFS